MFELLKTVVAELTRLETRADKWRDKTGRIEVSIDEYNLLARLTGGQLADEPGGEITIEEYVALIDAAIEAVVSKLKVDDAFDAVMGIAGEM